MSVSRLHNCSILGLHDRNIIASITDKYMTADLIIRTEAFQDICPHRRRVPPAPPLTPFVVV